MIDLKPDIAFKKELERISGSSLSTCMQCGTCSVVCNLSPEERPFPRKEMVYAGWGMKGKLIGNPDIWLCHQCGDCSTNCPRGVNPAEVFAATRELTYKHYARPKFLGKILSDIKWLPLAILIPVIIIGAIIYAATSFIIPEGPVNYSNFFPHAWLNASFTLLTALSYTIASIGFKRFWKDLQSQFPDHKSDSGFIKSFMKVKNDIFAHSRFNKCEKSKSNKLSHFLVFYGFLLLLFVTVCAIIAVFMHKYPFSFFNPFKILGNIASIMLFTGLGIMIYNRLTKHEGTERSSYGDWLFIIAMFLLTLSGVVIEAGRIFDWQSAYYLYFAHLVCVWFVIIYLPFTKFGHIVYRTIAMTYAFSINRK